MKLKMKHIEAIIWLLELLLRFIKTKKTKLVK